MDKWDVERIRQLQDVPTNWHSPETADLLKSPVVTCSPLQWQIVSLTSYSLDKMKHLCMFYFLDFFVNML